MTGYYVIAAITMVALFILFLVISKTLNNVVNLLIKIEYLFQKELSIKKEALEVRKVLDEQARQQEERERLRRETDA